MHVLLVEDHPDLAANLGDFLGSHGHSVDFAADGPSGLRIAQSQRFDAIVLDRLLPGLDGASVCRRLRAGGGQQVPLLMLTALDTVNDRVEGLRAGADDYLVKPFAMVELLARLEALHRRATNGGSERLLSVADLEFDLDTLIARRAGETISLTPALRKLLELLMRETHRVVTREELERRLWGDVPPEGDVLRAHMYALRVAVDKPWPRKLLQTIHGSGYRLADLGDS
ncbi:response regulator transcription factor [Nevskia sp.]|uniref:response regulator transcription factor n=1 Tax=Nevskia sp. TaxID=1929292 RepID=UPI0025F8181D|nr:response regulator transcription factor [Nevskia sp.]